MLKEEAASHESIYESIIDYSDDAIISKSLDGIITSWNKGAEKIFGYTAAEIVGRHISILLPPARDREDQMIIDRIKAGESMEHYETDRLKKDGTTIAISLTVSPLKNRDGIIIGASKIARDISSQKLRIEKLINLVKEIADYKYALDESSIVAITDQKGIIRYVNDNFCIISGYSREELIGQDHRIVNSGYHDEAFIRHLWTTIANGKVWKGEIRNRTKNGNYYWVDTTIVPFMNNDGKPYQYVAIRADITDRKIAEEKNLEMQHRYKQVVGNIIDGLIISDLQGKIIFTNAQFRNMFGIKDEDTDKLVLEEIVSLDYKPIFKAKYYHPVHNPQGLQEKFEFEGIGKNGEKRWIEIRTCAIAEQGAITCVQSALRDITRQRSAEADRMKVIADIVERNKDLEQFSYIISHNLRAPVANILGITDLLVNNHLSDTDRCFLLQSLIESTQKLDHIIFDLNNVTKIKLSSTERRELVSFSEIVNDILTSIGFVIERNEVTVITEFHDFESCYTVKSYMNSIFYNLITNSIKYKKPEIPLICEIRSLKQKDAFVLLFRDNGLGINLEHTGDQIFEIYKRFHIHAAEGRGMGLFMVKTHVESMGGKINVVSEEGKGTEFRIEFPLDAQ